MVGSRCLLLLVASAIGAGATASAPGACDARDFGYGSVACACNATHCDWLPRPVRPAGDPTALTFTSSKEGLRFLKDEVPIQDGTGYVQDAQRLTVNRSERYQTVNGFGGAFTDAAGINILSLPVAAQQNLLESYFSANGLEYSLGRVPIGGTDFSTHEYTYDDTSKSKTLDNFALAEEDTVYKIPMIKWAQSLVPAGAPELLLVGAAWSAPPWMKTNQDYSGFGFLHEQYFQSWADYHVKFLDAYAERGLHLWAISTGNEPLNGVLPINRFNSLGWLPPSHRTWIGQNLGPTLRASKHNQTFILALDDQRIVLPFWIDNVLSDKDAAKYIDGIAVHWYLDFITPAWILTTVHNRHPDKFLISTEACNGDKPWQWTKVQLGSWDRGEAYLEDIISGMNNWLTGWMDWNLALNPTGGPTWAKNFVDAAIIVNSTAGEFYKNPTFYAMGHFSKFVPRGSVRIGLMSKGGSGFFTRAVKSVAFLRPDGAVAIVLLNENKGAKSLVINEGNRHLAIEVPAKSFTTVLYW